MQAMNKSMQAMQVVIQDQHKFIKNQGEEIEILKNKISSGKGSVTSVADKEQQKQMAKDATETAKIVKDAVPVLLIGSPGNYDKWKERLLEVFKLQHYVPIANFLHGVGLEEVTGIVKKEEPETKTIIAEDVPTISEQAAQNFFAFLTSKLDDGFGPVVREANKCKTSSLQLKHLWGGIQRNFVLNTEVVRSAKMQEWYKVQQETEETFKEYVNRITKLRTVINSMFLPLLGHEKIDDSDMLTKIKTLNPYYMKMMSQNIITMETKRKKYGLQEWITNLECVESQHDIINPQEKTERVNMARTTTPLPVQPGTNFRATVNAAQAKQEWLCNNWNGEPGSCKYGQHCRFKHTNDKVVRRAHLKKVQEWQATQKAKADESKKKKNEDKSAKETAKKAAAQASGGAAAKDYVEIARAMMVVFVS